MLQNIRTKLAKKNQQILMCGLDYIFINILTKTLKIVSFLQ